MEKNDLFEWGEEEIEREDGEKLKIKPSSFSCAFSKNEGRLIEHFLYYREGGRGLLSQFEIKKWKSGGDELFIKTLIGINNLLDISTPTVNELKMKLKSKGCNDYGINFSLKLLKEGGYIDFDENKTDEKIRMI